MASVCIASDVLLYIFERARTWYKINAIVGVGANELRMEVLMVVVVVVLCVCVSTELATNRQECKQTPTVHTLEQTHTHTHAHVSHQVIVCWERVRTRLQMLQDDDNNAPLENS